MTNIIPLCFLDEAKTEDISKLSVADLLSLQERLDKISAEVKRHKSTLDNALELKFADKPKMPCKQMGVIPAQYTLSKTSTKSPLIYLRKWFGIKAN